MFRGGCGLCTSEGAGVYHVQIQGNVLTWPTVDESVMLYILRTDKMLIGVAVEGTLQDNASETIFLL